MWFDFREGCEEKDVTHWMPLPEPPISGDNSIKEKQNLQQT